MSESIGKKLNRVRKPWRRNSGAVELSFVLGIVGDFSGTSVTPYNTLAHRKFLSIDRDNFEDVMKKMEVTLHLRVSSGAAGGDSTFETRLTFHSLRDFEPEHILEQVEPLRILKQKLASLNDLLSRRDLHLQEHDHAHFRQLFSTDIPADKTLIEVATEAVASKRAALTRQLNAILHHREFTKLEGSWRGLHYLVMNTETSKRLKLKVLNVTKEMLSRDLDEALEFDLSDFFRKIYENEILTFGGEAYSALVGDFEFSNHPEDIDMLQKISSVCAAAHCPFISAAAPELFGLKSWEDFSGLPDLATHFMGPQYFRWNSFRDTENSRYVTLVLPRVLARLPYSADTKSVEGFQFEELEPDESNNLRTAKNGHYCWMNAAYAMATNMTRAAAETDWCTAIRGVENGGKVENLPLHNFMSDDGVLTSKCPAEIAITDRREAELSNEGFLPLCHFKNTDYSVFFGSQTCHRPKKYDGGEKEREATANAAISARLPYLMAVSRISHYMMVIAREKQFCSMTCESVTDFIVNWIADYIVGDTASPEMKNRYPLAEARLVVQEVPGIPACCDVVLFLRPHLQLESLTAAMPLVVRLKPTSK
jgi:type VI secretion system protein ImpC